jgi:uncharacterized membrane protein
MRVTTAAVVAIAILIVGLSLRPTPHATAAAPEANAQIDPHAMQSTIGSNTLPAQQFADPF